MDALTDVKPGDVLAGKYRIERILGQGGMGVVVAAQHMQLDERVAIKFLLPEALQSKEAVARFSREARAAVKIKSEHVARVIDVGTLETGSPYMVMEYLHGQDLASLVQQRGSLGFEEAVDYVLQACEAIAEAHALGIIHRDLKPQNLFLTYRADGSPCIKVLDFGISKVSAHGSGSDMSMTKTTAVMGSPLYMSPEQMIASRDVDVRTDIWALGVILHELLAGGVPFNADTVPQLCALILQGSPPPLRNYRPDAPEALQNVILRCLEKDPVRRYGNIAEFAAALLPFAPRTGRISVERVSRVLSAAGLSTSAVELPPSSVGSSLPVTQAAWGQTVSSKSRAPWIALALTTLGLGVAGAAVWWSRTGAETGEKPTPSADLTTSPVTATPQEPAPVVTPSASAVPSPSSAPAAPAATASTAPPTPAQAPPPTVQPAQRPPAAPVKPATTTPPKPAPVKPATAAPVPPPATTTPPPPATPTRRPTSELYNDRK